MHARRNMDGYRPLLGAIRAEGGDPRAMLIELGLDPDAPLGSGGPPPVEVALGLMERGFDAFGDGFLVRCAARSSLDDYEVLGFVCLTAPDVRTALSHAQRYRRLLFADDDYRHEERGAELRIHRRRPEVDRARFPRAARGVVELGLGEHLSALRELAGEDVDPIEVRFTSAAPEDASEHERFFRAPLAFDVEEDVLVVPAEVVGRPCRHGHPGMQAFFEAQARELLRRAPASDTVSQRVREVLAADLEGTGPTAGSVAKRLAMSERTLSRRLAEEGTSFRALRDELRAELATRYLRSGRMSVAEVAFVLGFSEVSAFHRAFKRWTGETPGAVRQGADA